jgi:hypothetical protein
MYFYSLWGMLQGTVRTIILLIWIIQSSSYVYTAISNPGIPKREMNFYLKELQPRDGLKTANFRICSVCNFIMNLDENTEHCDDCNVCIEGK